MMTKAREIMMNLHELEELVGEEMTQNSMGNGKSQDTPKEYRGKAKVVGVKNAEAKKWLGTEREIFVDTGKGETDLMVPGGQRASLADVQKWFDLEFVDEHP
jgi:hypothetical protein